MDNLTGIHAALGEFTDPAELASTKELLEKLGAQWSDELSPENTHLICEVPRGDLYQRAAVMNIPVVNPQWLRQCEVQKKVQPVGAYAVLASSAIGAEGKQ